MDADYFGQFQFISEKIMFFGKGTNIFSHVCVLNRKEIKLKWGEFALHNMSKTYRHKISKTQYVNIRLREEKKNKNR